MNTCHTALTIGFAKCLLVFFSQALGSHLLHRPRLSHLSSMPHQLQGDLLFLMWPLLRLLPRCSSISSSWTFLQLLRRHRVVMSTTSRYSFGIFSFLNSPFAGLLHQSSLPASQFVPLNSCLDEGIPPLPWVAGGLLSYLACLLGLVPEFLLNLLA